MTVTGPSIRPSRDLAAWETLAEQVREVRTRELEKTRAAELAANAPIQSGVPDPGALGERLRALIGKFPAVAAATAQQQQAALNEALRADTIYAPFAALVAGLKELSDADRMQPIVRYGRTSELLDRLAAVKAALETAGSALSSFPRAQLDALTEDLRAELRALVAEHGAGVRSHAKQAALQDVLEPAAFRLLEGMREALANVRQPPLHPAVVIAEERNLGGTGGWHNLAAVLRGGMLDAAGADLAAIARESGAKVGVSAMLDKLIERNANSVTFTDFVHAYVSAALPELGFARPPRPLRFETMLNIAAQPMWQAMMRTRLAYPLRAEKIEDLLGDAVRRGGDRALGPEELLAVLAAKMGSNADHAIALNQIAIQFGRMPGAGLPPDLDEGRSALVERASTTTRLVEEHARKLGALTTDIQSVLSTATGELRSVRDELARAAPEAAKGLVEHARETFDAALERLATLEVDLRTIAGGATEAVRRERAGLREAETALALALAAHRGRLEGKADGRGWAQAILQVEGAVQMRMRELGARLDALEGDNAIRQPQQTIAGAHRALVEALGQVLAIAARNEGLAEQRAQAEAARQAAEAKRERITSIPLSVDRLRQASDEELAAYALPGNALNAVQYVRRMGLSPELFAKVITGGFEVEASTVKVKPQAAPFASAMSQLHGVIGRIGMGLSPSGAADWIEHNLPAALAWQKDDADRGLLREHFAGVVAGLRKD